MRYLIVLILISSCDSPRTDLGIKCIDGVIHKDIGTGMFAVWVKDESYKINCNNQKGGE